MPERMDGMKSLTLPNDTCGCGHPVADHDSAGCTAWWRYPDVLTARPCGCTGVWHRTVK